MTTQQYSQARAVESEQALPDGFGSLGLDAALVAATTALGYEEPTAIQREAIPPLLLGRDVLGQAATGTGKTAAFALPLLERIGRGDGSQRAVRGLVLVPTRELAMQVAEAVHKYGRLLEIRVLPIYGGQSVQQQLRALRRGVDVVVATPGRALDHLRRGTLDLSGVEFLVLDEADEMLDMGFADELDAILETLPARKQTALFSATLPPRIRAISKRHLHDPVHVTIANETVVPGKKPRIREVAYVVGRAHKVAALARVIDMEAPTSAIIFCRTRTEVDELTETLGGRGYGAEAIHGGLSQDQRDRVLRRFRDGTSEILVATDVAARGLDIEHVSHVVNYDVPSSPDAYVHRIGRTGRAGRQGVAITLAEAREHRLLRNIEQHTKRKIAVASVPTVQDLKARRIELTQTALEEALEAGGLESYRRVVEALANDHDVLDLAAAAVKLFDLARDGGVKDEADIPAIAAPAAPAFVKGRQRERVPLGAARPRLRTEDSARIHIDIGRDSGIRPADLVGAIANEARLHSRDIGAIKIGEASSIVEVPADQAQRVMAALRETTIRGKKPVVRIDRGK
ncbi:MAG TPA: DEAD/DEAH box helicase [Verrucomicrobiae bacterium]|jgi:ATP-dependent RNA helicase DeaD|nr:DEAD/DEAH box helicase [Verrucomicrobiae bacterium]